MDEDVLAPMEFEADEVMVPVRFKNKKGVEGQYVMKELMGGGRSKYFNEMSARMKFNKEGEPTGITNYDGLDASLLCKVMFPAKLDDENTILSVEEKPVPKAVVDTWPSRIIESLLERAKRLSGLGKKAEEDSKND